jgi:hypothetical protein
MCHGRRAISGLFLRKSAAAHQLLKGVGDFPARDVGDYPRPAVFSRPNFSTR